MRVTGSTKDATWQRVRAAGVQLLYAQGYETMNTRQLAEAAGLKPGSLYYYFGSKEEFLHRLLVDLLEEIVADLESSLDGVGDVAERLDTFATVLVKWHVQRREETFIASIEVRSLSRERYDEYMQLRDRFDHALADILREGLAQRRFVIGHEVIARNAILSALTAISSWYDPSGPLGLQDITDDFIGLVRRMAGVQSR